MTLIGFWFIVFNATFNNISVISWWAVLLVEETGVPGENHRPTASQWFILFHNKPIFFYRFDFGIITSDMKVKPAITASIKTVNPTRKAVIWQCV
jgi:hypothetical protein